MVSASGHEFYAELPIAFDVSDFVRETVLPQLGKNPEALCSREELTKRIRRFLEQFGAEPVHILCDDFVDYVLFAEALGGDVPANIVYVRIFERLDFSKVEAFFVENRLQRHHALNDAKANKAGYTYP